MSNYEPPSENVALLPEPDVQPRYGSAVILLPWLVGAAGLGSLFIYAPSSLSAVSAGVTSADFWKAAGVGLIAQVVDGALGMAYGVTSTSFLLSVGVPPATASASVHLAEVFTTGFSGLSHWKLGNVNKALFRRLVITAWTTIAGLVVGGMFAAPFAAVLTKHASTKLLMILVSVLIIGLSLHNLVSALL